MSVLDCPVVRVHFLFSGRERCYAFKIWISKAAAFSSIAISVSLGDVFRALIATEMLAVVQLYMAQWHILCHIMRNPYFRFKATSLYCPMNCFTKAYYLFHHCRKCCSFLRAFALVSKLFDAKKSGFK